MQLTNYSKRIRTVYNLIVQIGMVFHVCLFEHSVNQKINYKLFFIVYKEYHLQGL